MPNPNAVLAQKEGHETAFIPFLKKKDPTGTRIPRAITPLTHVLVALPIISLVLNTISWIKYGVDVPFWDDWRQYGSGDMGRIDLRYLLTPANDTLYSFGLLLDSLAIRFLDGNTVAYQFISLVGTLGALLVLQWRLISLSFDNHLIRACAFSLTVLMVQPRHLLGATEYGFPSSHSFDLCPDIIEYSAMRLLES